MSSVRKAHINRVQGSVVFNQIISFNAVANMIHAELRACKTTKSEAFTIIKSLCCWITIEVNHKNMSFGIKGNKHLS